MVNSLRFTKSDKVDLSTAVNHRKRFKVLLVISFIWFTFLCRRQAAGKREPEQEDEAKQWIQVITGEPFPEGKFTSWRNQNLRRTSRRISDEPLPSWAQWHCQKSKKKNTKWIFDQLLVDDICIFWSFETRSCYVVSLAASRVSMFTLVQQKQMKT